MLPSQVKSGGRYQHYKGNVYVVVGVATHTETREELVVYQQEEHGSPLWTRSLKEFVEEVEWEGKTISRFKPLDF